MKTKIIKYSLKDRGRKHLGADRAYQSASNLPKLISAINSPATQERIKARDMFGYYGHGIRKLFGLVPPECKLIDGKMVCVEPAFITTYLKANSDGTLEHQTEFLDNKYGQRAWKMYQNKVGGFSSAIIEHTDPMVFAGFDWVFEPNFKHNRGWTLDGIENNTQAELVRQYDTDIKDMQRIIMDSIQDKMIEKSFSMKQEIENLSSLVLQQEKELKKLKKPKDDGRLITSQATFDALGDDSFLHENLPNIITPKEEIKITEKTLPVLEKLNKRLRW